MQLTGWTAGESVKLLGYMSCLLTAADAQTFGV